MPSRGIAAAPVALFPLCVSSPAWSLGVYPGPAKSLRRNLRAPARRYGAHPINFRRRDRASDEKSKLKLKVLLCLCSVTPNRYGNEDNLPEPGSGKYLTPELRAKFERKGEELMVREIFRYSTFEKRQAAVD